MLVVDGSLAVELSLDRAGEHASKALDDGLVTLDTRLRRGADRLRCIVTPAEL